MFKTLMRICLLFFLTCMSVNVLWAKEQPELSSPGGAEMDFERNITKCYGTETKPVEVHWQNLLMKAHFLEYNRNQDIIKGEIVEIIESSPAGRVVNCGQAVLDLNNNVLTAQKDVKIKYDTRTSFFGNSLKWDRKNDILNLSDQAQIIFDDWQITGDSLEMQLNKGVVTFSGPVRGTSNSASFRAGKLIFMRDLEKIYLEDNPVLRQGKNELSAVEIIYDLKTKKASFNNPNLK